MTRKITSNTFKVVVRKTVQATKYGTTVTASQRLMCFTDGRRYSRVCVFYFRRRRCSVSYQAGKTRVKNL